MWGRRMFDLLHQSWSRPDFSRLNAALSDVREAQDDLRHESGEMGAAARQVRREAVVTRRWARLSSRAIERHSMQTGSVRDLVEAALHRLDTEDRKGDEPC